MLIHAAFLAPMLALAQAAPVAPAAPVASSVSAPVPPASAPRSPAEDRLVLCLEQARSDPATAIVTASSWLDETAGQLARDTGQPVTSMPQQCLGTAYASLLRWDAAQEAFLAARDARPADAHGLRARLGAMAGNAALAGEQYPRAAELFAAAQSDAETAGENRMAGQIAADRARALVRDGNEAAAVAILDNAQVLAPQSSEIWLLSATLARRQDRLTQAQGLINTAAALAPQDGEVGLEAGLIAALAGQDDAARTAWNTVLQLAPDSPQSVTARIYLARLDGTPEAR